MSENYSGATQLDPALQEQLDRYGFSQVLVVHRQMAVLAASRPNFEQIDDHFLPTPVVLQSRTSGTVPHAGQPSVRHFVRLGISLGYVDHDGLAGLRSNPSIETIYAGRTVGIVRPVRTTAATLRRSLTWGIQAMRIDQFWNRGLTGKGVRVGHLDTGVDVNHPALKGRVAGFAEWDMLGNRVADAKPHDSDVHGTHTAGTIAGQAVGTRSIGVAPECEFFSGLVVEGGAVLARVLGGMEWMLENNVKVLSMSLGWRGYDASFLVITRRLRQQGVLPVFAIGNEGEGTSRSPGNYPETLSVGAVDRAQHVAAFSSSVRFNRDQDPIQPDVVAPGVHIISAKPGGGYQSMDGTSMATPHVAGLAALLWQAKPEATVDQIELAIRQTCVQLEGDPLRYGDGLVNPPAALAALTGDTKA
ncbi:MAG: S8 family serine peptidase [Chloroflexi bacterium SZAS-1]|nr:S8 family serine peptidase [Chloroflexi bacterium SZAS-1]